LKNEVTNPDSGLSTLDPKMDGTYQIVLTAGDYSIDFDVAHTNSIGSNNLPSVISIANINIKYLLSILTLE